MGVYNNIQHGQQSVSTAGTAEALNGGTTATTASGGAIAVRANTDNTGNIYVGDGSVDNTTGFILGAGESIALDTADVADVYIDADNAGDGVSWIAEVA